MMSFRLLTEYHSFLSKKETKKSKKAKEVGFRLLTEYHSFLFD